MPIPDALGAVESWRHISGPRVCFARQVPPCLPRPGRRTTRTARPQRRPAGPPVL